MSRTFSGVLLMLILVGILTATLNASEVKAQESGTIIINANGSITPSTAPISTRDNVTYAFFGDVVNCSIIVNRSNVVIDGSGYALEGSGSGNGISFASISNVSIIDMNITDFDYGVYVNSSSRDVISGNSLASNIIDGIVLYYCSNDTVSWNNVTANGCGIYLDSCSRDTVSWNNATANECGIYLGSSSDNAVLGNNATNNFDGIDLATSSKNTVCENTLTANNSTGVGLEGSSGNVFYHNNFVDNVLQVSSDGSPNTWDNGYPSNGNYWSDYQAQNPNAAEIGNSGIWNTPYVIDSNNTDSYPLVQPLAVSVPSIEFPQLIILPLFKMMITTLLAALAFEKKKRKDMCTL